MKGKCIVLIEPCKTEIMEFEIPHPAPGAVVLKMNRCSVCSSDVHIWRGQHPNPKYKKNFVLGHEGVGEIWELGEGVHTDWAGNPVNVGDRVIFAHYVRCHKCYACLHGTGQICEHNKMDYYEDALHWPHFIGTFGSHLYLLPIQPFFKLPDCVTDTVAASMNCAMATSYAAVDRSRIKGGETILIEGAGTLGLHAIAIAKERGARVLVTEGIDSRLSLAKQFGADEVIDLKQYDTKDKRIKAVKDLTNGHGAEAVIELCGQASAHEEAFELCAPGGRFVPTGIAWEHITTTIRPSYNGRKMVDVLQSFHYKPEHLLNCVAFLEKHINHLPYDKLCDAEFSFEQLDNMFHLMEEHKILRPALIP